MAQINIQKKKNNIWPWLIAAVVVIAAVLFFMFRDETPSNYDAGANPLVPSDSLAMGRQSGENITGNNINAFVLFSRDTADIGEDLSEYAAAGINHLSSAVDELNNVMDVRSQKVEEMSDSLTQMADRIDDRDTSAIRTALTESVGILKELRSNMQVRGDEALSELGQIAGSITLAGNRGKEQLKDFFNRSSDIVQNMYDENNTMSADTLGNR